jgi:carboxymethylenebutenolidase
MEEREVMVAASDGPMPTLVVRPEIAAAKAVVVMLMDGRGIREPLRDHARRLASAGYYVMLPNLFYRHIGQGPVMDVLDMEWMSVLNAAITPPKAAADVQACLDFARSDPDAPDGPAGLIGYCMGGRLSVVVAQRLGAQIAAVASIHPGYMATRSEDSPHRALDQVSAEVYFGIPETDPHLSPGAVARLRTALDETGVDYRMEILPGVTHGFSVPGNDEYDKPAAERVWECAHDLFARRLGVGAG